MTVCVLKVGGSDCVVFYGWYLPVGYLGTWVPLFQYISDALKTAGIEKWAFIYTIH